MLKASLGNIARSYGEKKREKERKKPIFRISRVTHEVERLHTKHKDLSSNPVLSKTKPNKRYEVGKMTFGAVLRWCFKKKKKNYNFLVFRCRN
jgi:hypothetical protein